MLGTGVQISEAPLERTVAQGGGPGEEVGLAGDVGPVWFTNAPA